MLNLLRITGLLFAFTALGQSIVSAQDFSYQEEPLLSIISDIEQKTPYRFLYREALISHVKLTFSANGSSLMGDLATNLRKVNIGLKVDDTRSQALIYAESEQQNSKQILINGYVLDANTGERLPYSTISWRDQGNLFGVSSTLSGSFSININSDSKSISFLVSFVGYKPKQFEISFEDEQIWNDISIRLEPEPYSGKEILVQGVNFYTASDTVYNGMIKVGTFSPLGENNAVRSLQLLPSVTMSSAINNGVNIRGSASDGFQVLLDGQTVYHQSHLFGLLDAMNPDVLKTSGFYYDVTPAQFQAPLGGTLSLITRTGSVNSIRGSAGFSNTATNATIEGPLFNGNSSWIISGRISHLDEINWLNNQQLIEYGLDVNRPAEIAREQNLPIGISEINLNEIDIQNTEAKFYDLHSKLYFESKKGGQFYISTYLGHDNASQAYYRDRSMDIELYETLNNWDTKTITSAYNTRIDNYTLSETRLGISTYESSYSKGDFEYQTKKNNNNNPMSRADSSILGNLRLQNSLFDLTAKQSFFSSFDGYNMEYGFNYSNFDVSYLEKSLVNKNYLSSRTSQQVDVFHQMDITSFDRLSFNIGNRVHYFSNGLYLKWSPRFKAEFTPINTVSLGLGFSRNYQFLNRIQFYNINSSDFWVLANKDQPPSSVNYYTTSLKVHMFKYFYIQLEAYIKDYDNLRLHQLNSGLVANSFTADNATWFYENEGYGKGIEFLIKNNFQRFSLSSAYTLSTIELKNDRINNGDYFYADWDRRHQLSFVSELDISPNFDFYLSWTYGSGAPNRLDVQRLNNGPRLPAYSRIDATMSYKKTLKSGSLTSSFSLYNILDRQNPWYSEIKQISVETRNRTFQASARTNVFDLGIQPSFKIGFYF